MGYGMCINPCVYSVCRILPSTPHYIYTNCLYYTHMCLIHATHICVCIYRQRGDLRVHIPLHQRWYLEDVQVVEYSH